MDYTDQNGQPQAQSWYYAVLASKAVLQQKVTELETNGYVNPAFYIKS